MDSTRVSGALDTGSIPVEVTITDYIIKPELFRIMQ